MCDSDYWNDVSDVSSVERAYQKQKKELDLLKNYMDVGEVRANDLLKQKSYKQKMKL